MSISINVYSNKTETKECYHCNSTYQEREELFDYNLTYNLTHMADRAGIYEEIYHPEDVDVTTAAQLIEPLTEALGSLESQQPYYERFNPPNGWGTYAQFVDCVRQYLNVCKEHPEGIIEVS